MPHDPNATTKELSKWFERCQKDQFQEYVSGKKTFQQFRAGIVGRFLNMQVTCLDDIKPDIEALIPNAFDPNSETRKLLKKANEDIDFHEDPTNQAERCLRSMYHRPEGKKCELPSSAFQVVSRQQLQQRESREVRELDQKSQPKCSRKEKELLTA